jgi:hypothetical protein
MAVMAVIDSFFFVSLGQQYIPHTSTMSTMFSTYKQWFLAI